MRSHFVLLCLFIDKRIKTKRERIASQGFRLSFVQVKADIFTDRQRKCPLYIITDVHRWTSVRQPLTWVAVAQPLLKSDLQKQKPTS
jgi:hypothetical protein